MSNLTMAQRAFEGYRKAENELRSMIEKAGDNIDAETQASLDKAHEESRSLFDAAQGYLEQEERARDLEKSLGQFAPAPIEKENKKSEIRSFIDGETRSVDIMPEQRDLTKGTATAGGNTVPTGFYNQLMEHLVEQSGVMTAGPTVLNTASGENLEYPVTTSHGAAALVSEATGLAESDPAFAKRTLGAYKFGQLIQVSKELLTDSGVDMEGYLARAAGIALGQQIALKVAVGTGSSQPTGIVTGSSAGVTGGTGVTGAFTADDLISLLYSVTAPYRNSISAAFLMSDASIAAVRKFKDSNNQYLYQPALSLGTPETLLGKKLVSDADIVDTALSAKSVIFGDISTFVVRIAGGVRFERSEDYAFNADLVTFRSIIRMDSILADQTGAVKHFVGGAS